MRKETRTLTQEQAFKIEVLKLASKMNVFRLSAGFDVDRAIEVWAAPRFQERWANEVSIGFQDKATKNQLRDFFSSAVVMIGRCEAGKAVTMFYNPWADGLLLVSVEPGKERPVLIDFQFMAGESWRKETPKTPDEFLSLYTAKEPLLMALARKYAAVEQRFNQEYPVEGPFEFLPASVQADAGKNAEELPPIVIRLAYRQRMFSVLLSEANAAVVEVVAALRKMFKAEAVNTLELAAYLAPTQNAEMLENVANLPVLMRRNLSPNYFTKSADGKSSLVGLVNPEMPRWFVAVRIAGSLDAAKPEVTLELFDLGLSSDIVQAATKGGAQ